MNSQQEIRIFGKDSTEKFEKELLSQQMSSEKKERYSFREARQEHPTLACFQCICEWKTSVGVCLQ